jgi:DNA helicase IV
VRVFSVEHIKGLEFEAVFFVDVDELATFYPDTYEKYLYVGVTRAATYLGMTCSNTLPSKLEPLRALMGESFH